MIKSNTWPGCSGPCCSSVVLYRPRAHFNINTKWHPTELRAAENQGRVFTTTQNFPVSLFLSGS